MSSDETAPYRLTPQAIDDLDDIWRFTAETWSIEQADRYVDALTRVFEALAAFPTMTRERTEFDPPVRIHTHQGHLVVYTVAGEHMTVLRLLGGRQDWMTVLRASEY